MRMRRVVGAATATVIGLSLYLAALVPMAAGQSECVLSVEPSSAPAGSEFMLSGSGYTPTRLILQKGDGLPVTIGLQLGTEDPFQIPIGSSSGDEGVWLATAENDDCSAEATFTVTLQNTDAIDDVLGSVGSAPLPTVFALVVIVGGFAAGMVLGRRSDRAA